jgi:hypothetical protein
MMRKIILLALLIALGWKSYAKYSHDSHPTKSTPEYAYSAETEPKDMPSIDVNAASQSTFACDGRVYCSQMKSCEEAKYFLEHCPNVKMDGNHDGVPCEQQWCR